tara:strand:+ start:345 stop:476 length:132 start_codon:yes stop_codon:yes gene_type:complete
MNERLNAETVNLFFIIILTLICKCLFLIIFKEIVKIVEAKLSA